MQAPRQSPECSHIGDSERSSRLNTSVASSFKSIQIDRTRTARRSGQNSTYNTPIRMRTRLKSHLSEARSRYVISRINVRRLLARILVLLAAVLPFVGSAIGGRCGDTPDQCGAAPCGAHLPWAVGWGGHACARHSAATQPLEKASSADDVHSTKSAVVKSMNPKQTISKSATWSPFASPLTVVTLKNPSCCSNRSCPAAPVNSLLPINVKASFTNKFVVLASMPDTSSLSPSVWLKSITQSRALAGLSLTRSKSKTSASLPPHIRSIPLPPRSTSFPCSPSRWSFPAPPTSVSLPGIPVGEVEYLSSP